MSNAIALLEDQPVEDSSFVTLVVGFIGLFVVCLAIFGGSTMCARKVGGRGVQQREFEQQVEVDWDDDETLVEVENNDERFADVEMDEERFQGAENDDDVGEDAEEIHVDVNDGPRQANRVDVAIVVRVFVRGEVGGL
jgi:hypothetical protein